MERMKTAKVKTAEQSMPSKKDCTFASPIWLRPQRYHGSRDRATILYKQKL
jgi:hypothetical protein